MTSKQQEGQQKEAQKIEARREYKCPECGQPAYYMGLDFKAPKKTDKKAWARVRAFIQSGKVYYRGSQD